MTDIELNIIETLKHSLGFDAPEITQEQFDKIVSYIMENETEGGNPKELVWRLCGCYIGKNFNKVIDIYIEKRDAYYLSELVSYVDGQLDQEYLTKKMIETKDLKFIDEAMSNCNNAMANILDEKCFKEIRDFYRNNKS